MKPSGIITDEYLSRMIDVPTTHGNVDLRIALKELQQFRAAWPKVREALPTSMQMEELAKTWHSFDKENRNAQHFYEGMLHIRSLVLKSLDGITAEEAE